jgi:hypothetical protein
MATSRSALIVNIGIFICILMLIGASISAVEVISEIETDIADSVTLLNGMGLRRFLSMKSATDAKELLLLKNGEGFGAKEEALKGSLAARAAAFNGLYNLVVQEDMRPGRYRDINTEPERTWHEY